MINALIISGGSFQGSALIKGLRHSSKVRIYMADCFQDNINKYECDVFHIVPLISQKADFLNKIEKIVVENNIHAIFPSTDHELDLLSSNKASIEKKGAKIAVSDYRLYEILINKIKVYYFLRNHGFPLLNSVDPQCQKIVFPIIGKPSYGFGSKGIIVVRNREEHKQVLKTIPISDYLWIPFLEEFEEFSIDFAISFNGKISPIVIRKRIRTAGGFAVITQYENNDIIQRKVATLAEILKENGGCGIFNVQVIRYGHGLLHFSDINPRVGTSSIFTLGVGVNLPLFMCSYFTQNPEAHRASRDGYKKIKMVRNLSEKWLEMMPKEKIKGFVFDLDDTLIDHKKWIYDKLSIIYKRYAHQLPDKEMFMLTAYQLIEEGKRGTLIDELKNQFHLSEGLRTNMIQSFRQARPASIHVFRDVVDNLAKLKRLGFKLCLLTDNPVPSQQQKINMLDFAHYFDAIIFSMKFDREKPDKFLFEKCALQIGENIDKLAMVGDNLFRDCYGAINAGYHNAYFIERKGCFFNFNYSYFKNKIKTPINKIVKIASLNELFYAFEDSCDRTTTSYS